MDYIIVVDVEDNGSGILVEVFKCIYEFFVIIKDFGKGIGLGMLFVYSIIEEYYG